MAVVALAQRMLRRQAVSWFRDAIRSGAGVLRGPCPSCSGRRSAPLCPDCRARSLVGSAPWTSVLTDAPLIFVGAYHARAPAGPRTLSPLGRALGSFKDRGDRYAGRCLGELLATTCATSLAAADSVVAVPSDVPRTRNRGLGPAAWLAGSLARAASLPLRIDALRRRPGHPPQRGLDGAARRRNARAAFELGPSPFAGYRVVLVDDVTTTGATLSAAVGLLREAGTSHVLCCVVACADEEVIARCRSRTGPAGSTSTATRRS